MSKINRRCFLVAAAAASQVAVGSTQASAAKIRPTIGFGFGTYGMQSLTTGEAMRQCAEIGYDGIELALMKGWPTEPTLLSRRDRVEMRGWLSDFQLGVPSLLQSLPCLRTPEKHRENIEKLKRAVELAHDLALDKPELPGDILMRMMMGRRRPQPKRRFPELESKVENMVAFMATVMTLEVVAEDVF